MRNICWLFVLLTACAADPLCPEGYELVPQKQTVVTPSGVVSQPNEYGQLPPGTLRVGENICIRKQGVIEPRPAFENFGGGIPIAFNPAHDVWGATKIWPMADDNMLVLMGARENLFVSPYYEMKAVYADGTSSEIPTLTMGTGSSAAHFVGKIQTTRTRERTIIVRDDSAPRVLADDDIGTTGGGSVTTRLAGLPMPAYIDISTAVAGDVLEDDNYTSYRAVFRRKSGSYTFQGAVSAPFAVFNSSGSTCNPLLTVYWDSDGPVAVGDLLEIYRVDPQLDIDLLDDRHRYAFSHVLTSANISAGFVAVSDTAIATSDDLYANGAQDGASQSNFMPPPSVDVATFKGATFYNATEAWHTRTISAKGGWGAFSATGVGLKEATISTTNGSPSVTVTASGGFAASEFVGMGLIAGSAYPTLTKITAASGSGPYTFTMATGAASTFSGDAAVFDVIEIDGVTLNAASARDLIADLGEHNAAGSLSVVGMPDQPLVFVSYDEKVTLLQPIPGNGSFTIRATHGDRYTPPLPLLTETVETSTADERTNRLFFSKIDQPEAVAPSSFLFIGRGTILRLAATQESLFAFCTDGIFRIVGDGDDWSVEPFDPDTVLLAPDAIDSMDNTIYALTSAGFVSIDERGVKKISSPLIGDQIRALWKEFQNATPPLPYTWAVQVACDKYRNEVWINFNDTDNTHEDFVQTFIWNTETNTFATQTGAQSIAVAYVPFLQSIVVGIPDEHELQLQQYSDTDYMSASLEFNPVVGEDVGYLKQWIDTSLLFEDLGGTITVTPSFEGVAYSTPYSLTAGTNFEHVAAVLQDYAYNKHCRFGIELDGDEHWSILGLTYRFRTASETYRS